MNQLCHELVLCNNKIQEIVTADGHKFIRKIYVGETASTWIFGNWAKVYDSVNNKVPYSEVTDTPTVDTTPTSGSSNLITSGGVYSYIDTMITQAITSGY